MRRAIRAAAWLYPKRWRERYGDEFEALLEDSRADWRSFVDVLKGAAKMQLSHWGFGRITFVSAVAGALIAAGISFSLPDRFVSQASVRIDGSDPATVAALQRVLLEAESRTALTDIINRFGLYPEKRKRAPIEDAIREMQQKIRISPIIVGRDDVAAFTVLFEYEDRYKAQRVTQALIRKIQDTNGSRGSNVGLDVLDPPSLPVNPIGPNRLRLTASGLLAGLTGGIITVVAIRMRRKSRGICPTCGHPLTATA